MIKKKYKLTDETLKIDGITLYRIRALKDFGDVKEGDLGGFVEHESNLSHDGNCWIYDNAIVYDDTVVYDNAEVFGNARIFGDAEITGNTKISIMDPLFR
ncbi:hypothetical protein [Bartonella senegalensis]|uniref:hypothetical protein n=1 Tax=Bartonella senegalensis TaxID=1468418 RepID=UPI0002E1EA73|nr:hypothetical protein [Bartonella senegalensis]